MPMRISTPLTGNPKRERGTSPARAWLLHPSLTLRVTRCPVCSMAIVSLCVLVVLSPSAGAQEQEPLPAAEDVAVEPPLVGLDLKSISDEELPNLETPPESSDEPESDEPESDEPESDEPESSEPESSDGSDDSEKKAGWESTENDSSEVEPASAEEQNKGEADPDTPPQLEIPEESSPQTPDVPDSGEGSVVLESDEDELGKRIEKLFRIHESTMSWVVRGGDTDGIGMFSLANEPAWDFDFNQDPGMQAEFHTSIHWLSGPGRADLPPRLFDFSWHMRVWAPDFIDLGYGEPISLEANFDIGVHGDFEDSVREGWRFPGRLLFMQKVGPGAYWAAGFEYLDLDHIQMLPAGGLILKSDDAELNLYFPRPKLRVRTSQNENHDEWLYVAGEYSGRGWAIERSATGLADVATLSEYRLSVGWEWEPTRLSKDADEDDKPKVSFWDVSWLFGRDLEYRSGVGNYRPHDTVMFRVGSKY